MERALSPDRLVVGPHRFAVTESSLRVTSLPWGELALDLTVEGSSSGPWLTCIATLDDVRVPGQTPEDLDGCVVEAAQGWCRDPDETGARVVPFQVYVDGDFDLVANRVLLRAAGEGRVRVTWTAATTIDVDTYAVATPSMLSVDVCATVRATECGRLRFSLAPGLDGALRDMVGDAQWRIWSWLGERGRSLAREGWFEGRAIQCVDFVLVSADAPSRRLETRPDWTVRVRLPVPAEALRACTADVTAFLQREIEVALGEVAQAYPGHRQGR